VTASPHQFFDAQAQRQGASGSAADTGTDPWGVRRAENLLTSLEGILSARVVTTPLGEVSEVHILASNGYTPKQVVRNVESALLAQLGLRVDHRKISIAQTADERPIKVLEEGAVQERVMRRAILFDDLVMATGPRTRRVSATVTLAAPGGNLETATEEGPDTPRHRIEAAARAAVVVLERLHDRQVLGLEGAQLVEAFGRSYVMVGVQVLGGRASRLLVGSAEVRESAEHAAVYAVLDATNRWGQARRG
jgi:hypothetical protein